MVVKLEIGWHISPSCTPISIFIMRLAVIAQLK
jgi:hypothetical protein